MHNTLYTHEPQFGADIPAPAPGSFLGFGGRGERDPLPIPPKTDSGARGICAPFPDVSVIRYTLIPDSLPALLSDTPKK